MKLLSLHPYLAFTLTRLKPLTTTSMTSCTPNTNASWNYFSMYHTWGHVLVEKTLVLDHKWFPLGDLPFLHQSVQIGTPLHVCKFTMPYPCHIILLNPITQKMFLYVIEYLSSPIQTVYTRTKIFFIFIQSTSFGGKLQELFNTFLICRAHATFIHPALIHLI